MLTQAKGPKQNNDKRRNSHPNNALNRNKNVSREKTTNIHDDSKFKAI